MSTGEMARLMGDDANDLIGGLGAGQKTCVDEQPLAFGHEGVDVVFLDDIDLTALGLRPAALNTGRE